MRTIHLSIDAGAKAAKALKLCRQFAPTLDFGPTLEKLRSGHEVLAVETDCADAVMLLAGLVQLVDGLAAIEVPARISMTEGAQRRSVARCLI